MPDIVWRAGLDLNPLVPADADTLDWLRALVWAEHEDRRQRLTAAARIAAREHLDIRRADLLDGVAGLAAEAPQTATLVVTHSATLAYLDVSQRRELSTRSPRPVRAASASKGGAWTLSCLLSTFRAASTPSSSSRWTGFRAPWRMAMAAP